MSQLSKILYEKLIYIRNGINLQVVKKVIGKVLWYLQCQHLASLLYFSHPATVTMALLSGSPIWSGISKKRRMNPEWRSLMRKRCHTSPLTSPWKTRSIEMGNTEMISKWTELGWICMNWDTFLQSFFFLFPPFPTHLRISVVLSDTQSMSLNSLRQFSTEQIPFLSCFSHTCSATCISRP